MGQVLDLAARRAVQQQKQGDLVYYCVRCKSDHFKLLADSTVQCWSCGVRIQNLFTTGPEAA